MVEGGGEGEGGCTTWLRLSRVKHVFITLPAKYGVIPDPFGLHAFFHMPRTIADAVDDKWAQVDGLLADKGVSVWCRDGDYRVCLMYDSLGSVAGIIVSVRIHV